MNLIVSFFSSDNYTTAPPSSSDEDIFKATLYRYIEIFQKERNCLTSDMNNLFTAMLLELQNVNPKTITKLKRAFPEWEWDSVNGGFYCEISVQTAIVRLNELLNSAN
jgi:hypothetical protein